MESTLLTSETHTLVHVEDHLWCSQSVQLVIFFSFIVSKSSAIMHFLFSPSDRKFQRSLGTFSFGGFIIIFVAVSLFASSAALMEFPK